MNGIQNSIPVLEGAPEIQARERVGTRRERVGTRGSSLMPPIRVVQETDPR